MFLAYWSWVVSGATGCAWAANRELLGHCGLYDACIIGGGDGAVVRAAYGCPEEIVRLYEMDEAPTEHCLRWALGFHDAVRGNVGSVEGNVMHLWHGKQEHRRYHDRWLGLKRLGFDPFVDIAFDPNDVWRWSSEKPQLHDYVLSYFESLREDG